MILGDVLEQTCSEAQTGGMTSVVFAQVSRQICALGSDAEPPRNPLIRRDNRVRQRLTAILRIALDQKIEGSNPSSPANSRCARV